jgi:hypothetical protein
MSDMYKINLNIITDEDGLRIMDTFGRANNTLFMKDKITAEEFGVTEKFISLCRATIIKSKDSNVADLKAGIDKLIKQIKVKEAKEIKRLLSVTASVLIYRLRILEYDGCE